MEQHFDVRCNLDCLSEVAPRKDRENGFQGKQEGQNSMSQERTENENCGGKYMYLFTQCIFYITYMSKNIHIS